MDHGTVMARAHVEFGQVGQVRKSHQPSPSASRPMGLSGSDDSSSERTGTDLATKCDTVFATPFSSHLCRIHAHSLRILCAFYAFSELSAVDAEDCGQSLSAWRG